MRLTKKGEAPRPNDAAANADVPATPWDHGMKLLGTGEYDVLGDPRDGRGPDQPGAQSPAPGTDPVDGEEKAEDGQVLTNMTKVSTAGTVDAGLPKSPEPLKTVEPPKPVTPAKTDGK